ncbi:hypothetical protein KI387_031999, partial [Taxus chinensis]
MAELCLSLMVRLVLVVCVIELSCGAIAVETVGYSRKLAALVEEKSLAAVSIARLGKQKIDDLYSLEKSLKRTDIAALVESSVKSKALPLPEKSSNYMYLVLTSEDVTVEGFCMSSCGFHANILQSPANGGKLFPYAWVGNSASQCP